MKSVFIVTGTTQDFDGTFAEPPWSDGALIVGVYTKRPYAEQAAKEALEKSKGKSAYDSSKIYDTEISEYEIVK